MKAILIACLVGLIGCGANTQELQKQLSMSEAENARLNEEIKRSESDQSVCVHAMEKVQEFKDDVYAKISNAWDGVKTNEPSVKKGAMIELDEIEESVKENTGKGVEAIRQWALDHNFTK
jgi:hypothetical protein